MSDMKKFLKRVFQVAHQLSAVRRFSRDHMIDRESVLEHMGFCGFFAYCIADRLKGHGVVVNVEKLLRRIIVHDLDEATLGDIPRITKYWSPEVKEQFAIAERDAVFNLQHLLDVSFLADWSNAKSDDLEGYIVKLTDLAAVCYKVWTEIELMRNMAFLRVAKELQQFLNEAMVKFDAVQNEVARAALKDAVRELHGKNMKLIFNNHDPMEL